MSVLSRIERFKADSNILITFYYNNTGMERNSDSKQIQPFA